MTQGDRIRPKPGRYEDIQDEAYHRKWEALNSSTLKAMDRSPAYARMCQTQPWRVKRTAATLSSFAFGKAVHMILTDGVVEMEKNFALRPPGHGSSKAYKEAKAAMEEDGVEVLSQEHWDGAHWIFDAVWDTPGDARETMREMSQREVSYVTIDPEHKLLCKIRPDFQAAHMHLCGEIKTGRDISAEGFSKATHNFGYHIQHGFYMRQLDIAEPGQWLNHKYVCISNSAPWEVETYELDGKASDLGRWEVDRLMTKYSACAATDSWPGSKGTCSSLSLPPWAFKQYNMERF